MTKLAKSVIRASNDAPIVRRGGCNDDIVDAHALNQKRIDDLIAREPEIAILLEACRHEPPHEPLTCAVCSEVARAPFLSELLRVAREYKGPHEVATVYLRKVASDSLDTVNIALEHGAFRARLRRCGFKGSLLCGGTEVAWTHKSDDWTLHCHLLAIGVNPTAWSNLRKALHDSGTRVPLQVDALRDEERQVSYLQKFTTYHRPFRRDGRGRSRAVPLPADRLAELARWWSRHSFDDFPFLFGARRRGGRIVPEV